MKTLGKIWFYTALGWRFCKPLLVAFIISYAFLSYLKIDIGKINDNDFLFNFFGILLGFAITIFTFIISMVEKIREKAEEKVAADHSKRASLQQKILNLFTEIKEDIAFTFISLVIIVTLYIFNYQIEPIRIFKGIVFEQKTAVQSLKLSLFVLNIVAIYDLIIISFKMSNTTGIIKISDNDTTQQKPE